MVSIVVLHSACNAGGNEGVYVRESKIASSESDDGQNKAVGLEMVKLPCVFGSSVIVTMPHPAVVNFLPVESAMSQYHIRVLGDSLKGFNHQLSTFGMLIQSPAEPKHTKVKVALFNKEGKQVAADFDFTVSFEAPRGGSSKSSFLEWIIKPITTGQGVLGWFTSALEGDKDKPKNTFDKVCNA
jgi:hypothetical protein